MDKNNKTNKQTDKKKPKETHTAKQNKKKTVGFLLLAHHISDTVWLELRKFDNSLPQRSDYDATIQ